MFLRRPPRRLRQALKHRQRVFVGIFGVQSLAFCKGEALPEQAHGLRPGAEQMHLDAAVRGVEAGHMPERLRIEIGAEFAVDAGEQIAVKRRRYAAGVVIRGNEFGLVLRAVHADEQMRAGAEKLRRAMQKAHRLLRGEVADGRAGKKADAGLLPHVGLQRGGPVQRGGEIGFQRVHIQLGKTQLQPAHRLAQKVAADIDGGVARGGVQGA